MPGMLSPCNPAVGLISAPVAMNNILLYSPASMRGSIYPFIVTALHPQPLPPQKKPRPQLPQRLPPQPS